MKKITFNIISMEDVLNPKNKKGKRPKYYCHTEKDAGGERCIYGQCDFCKEIFG